MAGVEGKAGSSGVSGIKTTRRQFLKSAGMGIAAISAASLRLAGTAKAAGIPSHPEVVPNPTGGFDVTPTGLEEKDIENVQWALDNAGPAQYDADGHLAGPVVLLKNAPTFFNFGAAGRAELKKDVVLAGERCPEGGHISLPSGTVADRSAVYGGGAGGIGDFTGALSCFSSIDFAVTGVWFDNSGFCSVYANHSKSRILIQDNVGTNLKPVIMVPGYGAFAYGIFGAMDMHPLEFYPMGNMHGEVVFEGNVCESSPKGPVEDITIYGMLCVNDVPDPDFKLTATNNHARGEYLGGIWCPGISNLYAEGNSCVPSDYDPDKPDECAGNTTLGISIYPHIIQNFARNVTLKNNLSVNAVATNFNVGTANIDGGGGIVIEGNEAYNTGTSPAGAWGTWGGCFACGESNGMTIKGNRITCAGGSPALVGIALDGSPESKWDPGATTSESDVDGNTLEGLFVYGMYTAYSYKCGFEGNDLSGATFLASNVLLGPGTDDCSVTGNKIGAGDAGIAMSFLRPVIEDGLFFVQGHAGYGLLNNRLEGNVFNSPSQVHYLIHDSIWALVPTPSPRPQFKVDAEHYPHFENNRIVHSGTQGNLQLENVDEQALAKYGNAWADVKLTEASPVSNDGNVLVKGPSQGPKWQKIRAMFNWAKNR